MIIFYQTKKNRASVLVIDSSNFSKQKLFFKKKEKKTARIDTKKKNFSSFIFQTINTRYVIHTDTHPQNKFLHRKKIFSTKSIAMDCTATIEIECKPLHLLHTIRTTGTTGLHIFVGTKHLFH